MKFEFIFQLIRAATTFSNWYKKASEDGVVHPEEVGVLLRELASVFGIDVSIKLPEITE